MHSSALPSLRWKSYRVQNWFPKTSPNELVIGGTVPDVTDYSTNDIFLFAHTLIDEMAADDPLFASRVGIAGYDHLLPRYRPEWYSQSLLKSREWISRLERLTPVDDVTRIAYAVMHDSLATSIKLAEAKEYERSFSVISSPVDSVRQSFELMTYETVEARQAVAQRLDGVASAFVGLRETWRGVRERGELPPVRHVLGVANQAIEYGSGGLVDMVHRLAPADADTSSLLEAAHTASAAFLQFGEWIKTELAPHATTNERAGRERYALWVENFTGATYDWEELYAWGWEDLTAITNRMKEVGRLINPELSTFLEVANYLDNEPSRQIEGTDELLRRLRELTDQAIEQLNGVHFDIDPRIQFCDVRLAPPGGASAPYYISPNETLTRPGTTWFPTMGETTFQMWRHTSTWYHEGVPGHHLEAGSMALNAARATRFHRLAGWSPGYGEGWALYAERFMDELGAFADPGDEMGYLSNQALRAARVVVDIGLHLGLTVPEGLLPEHGITWTPELAVKLLEEVAIQPHVTAVSEIDRYLGWPGQAISYKVGEKCWLEAREAARNRLGDAFDLKAFHKYGLQMGPVGLKTFMAEMERFPSV